MNAVATVSPALKYGVSVKLRATLEWRSLPGLVYDTQAEARAEVVRINTFGKADGAEVVVAVVRSISAEREGLIFQVERTVPVLRSDCPACGGVGVSWLVEGMPNGYVDSCADHVQDAARDTFDDYCVIELPLEVR